MVLQHYSQLALGFYINQGKSGLKLSTKKIYKNCTNCIYHEYNYTFMQGLGGFRTGNREHLHTLCRIRYS